MRLTGLGWDKYVLACKDDKTNIDKRIEEKVFKVRKSKVEPCKENDDCFFFSVRNDILAIMLNRRFIDEVFKPQPPYTRCALRRVFERLAHGSIMRLNTPSMDKVVFFFFFFFFFWGTR